MHEILIHENFDRWKFKFHASKFHFHAWKWKFSTMKSSCHDFPCMKLFVREGWRVLFGMCAWFDCHTYSRLNAHKNHLLVTNNDFLHPRFQRVISHEIESTQTDSCVSETTMKNPWQVIYNILHVINVLPISRLYYYTVTNWAKSADYPIVNQWALMCLLGSGD